MQRRRTEGAAKAAADHPTGRPLPVLIPDAVDQRRWMIFYATLSISWTGNWGTPLASFHGAGVLMAAGLNRTRRAGNITV